VTLIVLRHDFTIVYKPNKTHVVVDILSRLLNTTKPTRVPNQSIDASLFYTKLKWLNDVKDFMRGKLKQRYLYNRNIN
jgi:hypothetical protein